MSSRENCNTYIINGVVEIRSYQAYLNYYFDVQHYREEHKTLHYVGAQLDKARNVVILKFVDTGRYYEE